MVVGSILRDRLISAIEYRECKLNTMNYFMSVHYGCSKSKLRNLENEIKRLRELLKLAEENCLICSEKSRSNMVPLDLLKKDINNNNTYFISLDNGLYFMEIKGIYERVWEKLTYGKRVDVQGLRTDEDYRKVVKQIRRRPEEAYKELFNFQSAAEKQIITSTIYKLHNAGLLNGSCEQANNLFGYAGEEINDAIKFLKDFDRELKVEYRNVTELLSKHGIHIVHNVGKRSLVRVEHTIFNKQLKLRELDIRLYK